MHFLVTGGAGFIGSHLVEKLLIEGHDVTVIDNLTTGNLYNLPNHPKLRLLSKDLFYCRAADFSDCFDGIAHLAATPSVVNSWQEPLTAHHNNTSGVVAAIQLCQQLKIPRFVFASSAAVYGNPLQLPITEDCLIAPISPYGLQKWIGEQYLSLFAQTLGLSVVNLRLFNVFGSRQAPNSPYSGVISIFVKAMQENLPISIYGDGTQTRDFVYVRDIATAFSKALTMSLDRGECITCNIGTGQAISLLDLIHSLGNCFPFWTAGVQWKPARLGDIQHSVPDISKAASSFSFKPEWSLHSGLKDLIDRSKLGTEPAFHISDETNLRIKQLQ